MNGVRARAAAAVLGGALLLLAARGVTRAQAERGANVEAIELWVVATPHVDGATSSEVRLIRHTGELQLEQTWATIRHAPNVPIRGDVLSDRKSLVVAFEPEGVDPRDDFSAEVHIVDSQGSRRLATGLCRATRPFVTSDGGVFVERGRAGNDPPALLASAGELRVDSLSIDALDPESGSLKPVVQWSGYTMHLIGEWSGSLVVYRVSPDGADVALIRISDGSIAMRKAIEPVARDFVIVGDRVAFSNHDPQVSDRWLMQAIDLRTLALTTLGQTTGQSPIPFVNARGVIGMRAEARTRPIVHDEAEVPLLAHERPDLPLAMSADGAFTVVATPGEFDVTEDVHAVTKQRVRLTKGDERVEFIGYREGTKAVLR